MEIQEGLEAGELVITLGNNAIRPEALVRLPDDPDPPDEDADKGDDASAGGAAPAEGAAPADADEAGDEAGQPEDDKASDGEG